ncbi:type 1 glutamine amidotransferase family protein [Thermostaphylospora chromogena]|uniref:Putative intracellular protease/amidase n=1 Tax=Thermostaphylospora chromogena TaxID=35622 RepID=A0A1H1FUS4_9ACTN|nr:type 1 glutamine amidotransferase family protein [Thermostaphylospora chromogena]SDR04266.1 Putative intracellular protease/amidase [Thermostaphylospora chromogena]
MGREIVHLAVYDTMADWEAGHAVAHIRNGAWQCEPGRFDVATVGATTDPITTMGGTRVVPDTALDRLDPGESAMLILPGAAAWDADPDRLAPFARKAGEFLAAGVPVAAICGATAGLAREGLLDDRAHTSGAVGYLNAQKGYGGAGRYLEQPAVTDGDLVTAGPTAPVEFAREIFARLGLYTPEVLDAWYRLFSAHDPSAYAVLEGAAQP